MGNNETCKEWMEAVGILPDEDVIEAWDHQQKKIEILLEELKQYGQ